jgi:hypothetical protein
MSLENQLRDALRRQDPPAGFAERVVFRASAQRPETPRPRFRLLWPATALTATVALVLSISIEYRAIREERAARQTIQALQIVSEELNAARDQIVNQ